MTLQNALLHILNFILPAVFVGGLLAALAPLTLRITSKRSPQQALRQWLMNALAGMAALLLGLGYFENDGKMMSYAALVLASGGAQFVQLRAWRH